jgi:polygalacturonase
MAAKVSRRRALVVGLGLAGGAAAAQALGGTAVADSATSGAGAPESGIRVRDLPWGRARAIVASTRLPRFPRRVFNVLAYGAVADGTTDNTAAFKAAIEACNRAGGGRVLVPAGTYLTGAIHLKSNVDLHLEAGATLTFSGDVSRYPTVLTRYEGIECMNHSPMIYAYRERNIALTGSGTLDAGQTSVWNKGSERAYLESLISQGITDPAQRVVPGSGHVMRSTFVEPYRCDTVLIQGVTLKNPLFWQLHPTLCRNVTIDGVSTDPSTAHSNTDACDPESCDHVVIKNCNLGAHDDNVAIKSGRDADGRRVNVPSQNIVVFGCTMNGNWGAITCGSEMTGGIRNVYAFRCQVVGATKFALYVKSNTQRGGFAENINLDSFTGTFARSFAFVTMTYNGQTGDFPPTFGPFAFTNSSCTSAPLVFDVNGLPTDHITRLAVKDCAFDGVTTATNRISNVDELVFTNVTINGQPVTG